MCSRAIASASTWGGAVIFGSIIPWVLRNCLALTTPMSQLPAMLDHRKLFAQLPQPDHIEVGAEHARSRAELAQDLAPRRDDQRVAVGLAAAGVLAALRRGHDVDQRLDRARLQQR